MNGGVERFAQDLAKLLELDFTDIDVVPPNANVSDSIVIGNGMVTARTSGKKIHIFHGCWIPHMRASYSLSEEGLWVIKRMATGAYSEIKASQGCTTVAVSQSVLEEIKIYYRKRVDHVIPNFVPKTKSKSWAFNDVEYPHALFLGRAEKRKRPELASKIMQQINLPLIHIGSGLVNGSVGLGILERNEVANVMRKASFLISTSAYEANSLAILEALQLGLPVVSTRVGWMKTLEQSIPEYSSLLGDVDAFDQLLDACNFALNNNLEQFMRHKVSPFLSETIDSSIALHKWRSLLFSL